MQLAENISRFGAPRESIGDLDADTAARFVSAGSDVAMVIDRTGVIRDIAISSPDMPADAFSRIVERRWVDTVASESRHKVEEMLRDATGESPRWREINQQFNGGTLPFRYVALDTGNDGKVIALGRDLRAVAALQQRLLNAQQSMERDYVRLRQAESRYRLLFQMSSEAVLILDPASKKIVEANPAAGNLLGAGSEALMGQFFTKLFHASSHDNAVLLLMDPGDTPRGEPVRLRFADGRGEFVATSSLFRQDNAAYLLVRITPPSQTRSGVEGDTKAKLLQVLNRIPDAFAVTDDSFNILDVNMAFLELSQLASAESARGRSLLPYIGRAGVEVGVLAANLREHGSVRSFGTTFNTGFGSQEDVEISAVLAREGLETYAGFIIRSTKRMPSMPSGIARELPRTGEQLTELVGRMSLREIVRETTDVIERMCIEAALDLTSNNRASAAEVLGLSRQSLYAKLNRYGLSGPDTDSTPEKLAG